jgi:hypothetical protein
MFIYDPGLEILLAAELLAAILATVAWVRVWQSQEPARLRWAAAASACSFAFLAALIAFFFDTRI